ncbi:MAG: twin-arginine translocase subunit TatB [Gammaproteobacteria bacterium]|nr:twin-arginine translocase subunit TatB [Gammaproteobacteria bacterium]
MFDISFSELILVAIVMLLVIGPDKLPETLRTLGLWLGRLRRSFTSVKSEIEREIGMDDVRRQLHNEAIMDEMKRIEREVKNTVHVPAASSATAVAAKPVETSAANSASAAEPKPDPTTDG